MGDQNVAKHTRHWRPRLVVMVKAPVAGNVKTRLARGLGVGRATRFYRHASANVVARLSGDPRWDTWLAVAPDIEIMNQTWPHAIRRHSQGTGDLGDRMQRIMDNMPPGPVVIVGTDIPEIDRPDIARAFNALGSSDTVFGPAEDGGYWLVGHARRRAIPRMFQNVRWSSEHTLSDTLVNLGASTVAQLNILNDVDDLTSYSEIGLLGARRILPLKDRTDT